MTDTQDEQFWKETVKGVKKLPKSNIVQTPPKKVKQPAKQQSDIPMTVYKHNLNFGTTADIDKNTLKRFKKEEFGVDATLDLHGYTEDNAYLAVYNFVTQSYLAKKRCILIITGKGLPHPNEDIFAPKGVLKEAVPQWLKTDQLKQLILTYIHPSEKLGGSGAIYILLRRNRS